MLRSPLTFHVSRLSRLKRPGEIKSDAHREQEKERERGGCMKDLWIFERKSRLTNRYFVCREKKGTFEALLFISTFFLPCLRHHLASSTKRAPGRKRVAAWHIVRRQKSSLTASHILNWRVEWFSVKCILVGKKVLIV
jgi:hypothetical protein